MNQVRVFSEQPNHTCLLMLSIVKIIVFFLLFAKLDVALFCSYSQEIFWWYSQNFSQHDFQFFFRISSNILRDLNRGRTSNLHNWCSENCLLRFRRFYRKTRDKKETKRLKHNSVFDTVGIRWSVKFLSKQKTSTKVLLSITIYWLFWRTTKILCIIKSNSFRCNSPDWISGNYWSGWFWLPQSRTDGYLARFCQNVAKTAYLARSDRKMVILQDLAEKWLSCKILASSFRSSCPLIGSHSCNTFHFDQIFT